jgi:cytoskeletal protein RodZ
MQRQVKGDRFMLYPLLLLCAIICALGFLWSLRMIRKQQYHEKDASLTAATAKYPVLGNPGLWAYILFPILILLGAVLLMNYLG